MVSEPTTQIEQPILPAGTLLDDRFLLLGVLGRGAFGVVYKAHHRLLQNDVAIKILHAQVASEPRTRSRFKREFITSASLIEHPCIRRVQSAHESPEGHLYLVMDLLEGESLDSLLDKRNTLEPELCFSIIVDVLSALQYAHNKGIVHRDVKPANIFLCHDGRAKLVDFGIAKLVEVEHVGVANQQLTTTGKIQGTCLYMSPEQCAGAQIDARADIYSIGCVLYEALLGNPPYTGESSYEVMYKHLNDPLPSDLDKLPGQFAKIVTRCMQKKKDDRYPTVDALLQELSGMPIGGSSTALAKRFFALCLGVVLVMVIGIGIRIGITYANSQKPFEEVKAHTGSSNIAPIGFNTQVEKWKGMQERGDHKKVIEEIESWLKSGNSNSECDIDTAKECMAHSFDCLEQKDKAASILQEILKKHSPVDYRFRSRIEYVLFNLYPTHTGKLANKNRMEALVKQLKKETPRSQSVDECIKQLAVSIAHYYAAVQDDAAAIRTLEDADAFFNSGVYPKALLKDFRKELISLYYRQNKPSLALKQLQLFIDSVSDSAYHKPEHYARHLFEVALIYDEYVRDPKLAERYARRSLNYWKQDSWQSDADATVVLLAQILQKQYRTREATKLLAERLAADQQERKRDSLLALLCVQYLSEFPQADDKDIVAKLTRIMHEYAKDADDDSKGKRLPVTNDFVRGFRSFLNENCELAYARGNNAVIAKALDSAQSTLHDPLLRGEALSSCGHLLTHTDLVKAKQYYLAAIDYFCKSSGADAAAAVEDAANGLAVIFSQENTIDATCALYRRCADWAEKAARYETVAKLVELEASFRQRQDPQEAIKLLLSLTKYPLPPEMRTLEYARLAEYSCSAEDFTSGAHYFAEAEKYANEVIAPWSRASLKAAIFRSRGDCEISAGHPERAETFFRQSLAVWSQLPELARKYDEIGAAYLRLAQVQRGYNPELAYKTLWSGMQCCRPTTWSYYELASTYVDFLLADQRLDDAAKICRAASMQLARVRIVSEGERAQIRFLQASFDALEAQLEARRDNFATAVKHFNDALKVLDNNRPARAAHNRLGFVLALEHSSLPEHRLLCCEYARQSAQTFLQLKLRQDSHDALVQCAKSYRAAGKEAEAKRIENLLNRKDLPPPGALDLQLH